MAKSDVKQRAKTPTGCAVFEHLVRPRKKDVKDAAGQTTGTRDQWQVCLVFDAETDLRALKDVAGEVAEEAFGKHWKALVQQGTIKWPFRNGGDINPETGEPRFGEGTTFCNISSNHGVEVVSRYKDPRTGKARLLLDREGKPLVEKPDDYVYPGVHMRCGVTVASFKDESGSKGITMYINTAQTLEYGERLGGGVSAEDEWADDLEDAPEAEMPEPEEEPGNADSLL